jgi:aspartyl-tRNA(Asn)/glutamyl-tRNA(Gln) amidotransferase subunit B
MEWEMVAGLEIHARVKTRTKLFCSCSNDTFNAEPNRHICPVCAGFPGALPVLNREALLLAIKTGLALRCEIPLASKCDRKSYFYPDLPSGYQISQYDEPVAQRGTVEFFVGDAKKAIRLNRLHIENDAGKLIHEGGDSLVDLNRAGSPLMEMVTEADFRTPEEIPAFLKELQKILRAVGSSDADMEKGMMRCDVNISLRPKGQEAFGTKTELKNMNSFANIEKAVRAEVIRQRQLLESGGKVTQETRGWDVEKEVSVSQRSKEEAADYRYFPEPDLPPLVLTTPEIDALRAQVPELPAALLERFVSEYGLNWDAAEMLAGDAATARYFERAAQVSGVPKKTANWICGDLLALLNESGTAIDRIALAPENLGKMVALIEAGTISGKIAKDIFAELFATGTDIEAMIAAKGLAQVSDSGAIEAICREVIAENAAVVADFRAGKEKALGALVGQVMKKSQGKANPPLANEILRRLLKEQD